MVVAVIVATPGSSRSTANFTNHGPRLRTERSALSDDETRTRRPGGSFVAFDTSIHSPSPRTSTSAERQGEGRVPFGGAPGIDVRFVVFAPAAEARTWNGPIGILGRAIAVTGGAVYVATATRASHRGLPVAGTQGCR